MKSSARMWPHLILRNGGSGIATQQYSCAGVGQCDCRMGRRAAEGREKEAAAAVGKPASEISKSNGACLGTGAPWRGTPALRIRRRFRCCGSAAGPSSRAPPPAEPSSCSCTASRVRLNQRRLVGVSAPAVPPTTAPAPAPRPRPRMAPPAAPPAAPIATFLARRLPLLRFAVVFFVAVVFFGAAIRTGTAVSPSRPAEIRTVTSDFLINRPSFKITSALWLPK